MAAGYSTNPLYKKLGLKEGMKVALLNAPPHYHVLIGDISGSLIFSDNASGLDFMHLFTNSAAELANTLPVMKERIKKTGIIWISWYKKSSGKASGMTENIIRDCGLVHGLVDVKVCAVDDDWSGLKLVYRIKDR